MDFEEQILVHPNNTSELDGNTDVRRNIDSFEFFVGYTIICSIVFDYIVCNPLPIISLI